MCAVVSLCGMRRVLARCARRLLSQPPAAAQAHRVRVRRAGPVRRRPSPRCATPSRTGRGRRCASRSPGPTGLDYVAVALPRHQPRHARRRARGRGQPPPERLAGRRIWPRSCSSTRPSRAMRAPDRDAGDERPRQDARDRPAGLRPRAAGGERPALRPAGRGAAARLRRALDHRPGAGRRLRARRSTPSFRQAVAPPARARAVARPPPCPPCPPSRRAPPAHRVPATPPPADLPGAA